jgi:hypothetical protein
MATSVFHNIQLMTYGAYYQDDIGQLRAYNLQRAGGWSCLAIGHSEVTHESEYKEPAV